MSNKNITTECICDMPKPYHYSHVTVWILNSVNCPLITFTFVNKYNNLISSQYCGSSDNGVRKLRQIETISQAVK